MPSLVDAGRSSLCHARPADALHPEGTRLADSFFTQRAAPRRRCLTVDKARAPDRAHGGVHLSATPRVPRHELRRGRSARRSTRRCNAPRTAAQRERPCHGGGARSRWRRRHARALLDGGRRSGALNRRGCWAAERRGCVEIGRRSPERDARAEHVSGVGGTEDAGESGPGVWLAGSQIPARLGGCFRTPRLPQCRFAAHPV